MLVGMYCSDILLIQLKIYLEIYEQIIRSLLKKAR